MPGGGFSMTTYSVLSMPEFEVHSPHAPAGSLQSAPWSTHRSRSYRSAWLAPALAAGSSHVSTTTRRCVPGSTVMSWNENDDAFTVPPTHVVAHPAPSNCAQCSR